MLKNSAVSIAGPEGAAYTIKIANWRCGECNQENYARNEKCFRCKAPKPSEVIEKEREEIASQAIESDWREAYDMKSRQIYYYNIVTNETSWNRPKEMGPAPYATGFLGRGESGSTVQTDMVENNRRWLQRPARQQLEVDPSKFQNHEGDNDFNIWYGKYLGDKWKKGLGRERAPHRCDPEFDAGYTFASKNSAEKHYFCINFARGECFKGQKCIFYHHLPTALDEARSETARDVFGRERFATHREDMSGVGSINSEGRTIYVAGLRVDNDRNSPEIVEARIRRNFGVWGEIESVNVIKRLQVAFVRYRCRCNAEFALVAMMNQSLGYHTNDSSAESEGTVGGKKGGEDWGNGEVLLCRWAHDDPNPLAREAAIRADFDLVGAAINAKKRELALLNGQPLADDAVGPSVPQFNESIMIHDAKQSSETQSDSEKVSEVKDEGHEEDDQLGKEVNEFLQALMEKEEEEEEEEKEKVESLKQSDSLPSDQESAPSSSSTIPDLSRIPPAPTDTNSAEYANWYYYYYLPLINQSVQPQASAHISTKRGMESTDDDFKDTSGPLKRSKH